MILLNTHNICFGWEIRKLFFCYALLTNVLLKLRKSKRKEFSNFPPKTYVVGAQKSCLNETAILSTQNICWKIMV